MWRGIVYPPIGDQPAWKAAADPIVQIDVVSRFAEVAKEVDVRIRHRLAQTIQEDDGVLCALHAHSVSSVVGWHLCRDDVYGKTGGRSRKRLSFIACLRTHLAAGVRRSRALI